MKYKKLPYSVSFFLSNARAANTTLSLNPGSLEIPGRNKNINHPIADLVSAKGDEISKEYIALDNKGRDVLKSDKYVIAGNVYYEASKKTYDHHHIIKPDDINQRLNSIIEANKDK